MHESGFILGCDLAEAAGKGSRGQETDAGPVEMSIKANHVTREITALVSLQDLGVLELAIQLPASWPLQDTKLECRKLVRTCLPLQQYTIHAEPGLNPSLAIQSEAANDKPLENLLQNCKQAD